MAFKKLAPRAEGSPLPSNAPRPQKASGMGKRPALVIEIKAGGKAPKKSK